MAHDLDAIAATLKEASYRAATPMDAEVDALVAAVRWAQNAPHYEDCDARGWRDGERPPDPAEQIVAEFKRRWASDHQALTSMLDDGWIVPGPRCDQ